MLFKDKPRHVKKRVRAYFCRNQLKSGRAKPEVVRNDPLTGSEKIYTDVMEAEQKNNWTGNSLSVCLIWKSHTWLFVIGCPLASSS